MHMHRATLTAVAVALSLLVIGPIDRPASAQMMAKAQVANLIAKVENGVDDFRKYLEKRAENAREASSTAQASGRKKRQATETQKATASSKKDALDDALGDLNRSTNRLRRKFDATDKWMETKAQVEKVVDDGRKINQVVARGSYGPEAAKLWAVLRTGINDLARAYGVPPMAI
jgi:type III secretory pathway component EscR